MDSYRYSPLACSRRRELGLRVRAGDRSGFQHHLAANVKVHHTWDPRKTIKDTDNGGVFNFDFSKDGSILGVACERKSVLLFDPFNGKLVASKQNAHTDCVNCVKFLDDRMFATCSDDTTVALWDVRYLKHTVQTFRGHSNWVKNIEYDSGEGKLITSGFDGCIYTWDINRYNSENTSNRVFYTSGLMRSKLFPDASKLLISTHEGYIIVIHNLDLTTLAEDLKGFKPNMYRLMQRTKTPLRIGLMYNHVFEQKRNRVEFISDWPSGNDANIISSLQVHPQGWCVASRNTDASENTEWTCVHEIQNDYVEKKKSIPSWEVEAPHTSSAYCSSTNTPAYSSVAPSTRRRDSTQDSSPSSQNQSRSSPSRNNSSSTRSSSQRQERHNNSRNSTETLGQNQRRVISQLRRERTQHSDDHPVATIAPPTTQSQRTNARAPTAPAAPEEETPSSGRIHDALIQIRRGAQNDDGNFSLSISVHTASGRTLEFNQSDLESDEEDEDVVIEQIFSGADPDNERNSELQRRYFSRLFQRTEVTGQSDRAAQSTAARNFTTNTNHNPAVDDSSDDDDEEEDDDSDVDSDNDADADAVSDIGADNSLNTPNGVFNELSAPISDTAEGIDSETEEQEAEFDLSEESDEREGLSFNQQLYRAAVGSQSAGSQQDLLNDIQSAQRDLHNSNTREVSQNVNNRTRLGVTRDDDEDSDNVDDSVNDDAIDNNSDAEDFDTESSRPVVPSSNANDSDSLSAQSASNTLMFLIQRNSGDRRRRLVNLRYMEGYTERENSQLQAEIHMNQNRLKTYIEECNVGRGFIKELAFSGDGRLISSPFGFGFRIFAFDSNCNELCDCVPTTPVKLYEVALSLAHTNCVVATKFSPMHNLIVSGCLDGKITFHQPVL